MQDTPRIDAAPAPESNEATVTPEPTAARRPRRIVVPKVHVRSGLLSGRRNIGELW